MANRQNETLVKLRSPVVNEPEWFREITDSLAFSSRRNAGVDHVRGYKHVVILQPYHAHGEDLLILLNACKERGLKVFISGMTNYYPSATFTICIYKPEHEKEVSEYTVGEKTNIVVPKVNKLMPCLWRPAIYNQNGTPTCSTLISPSRCEK